MYTKALCTKLRYFRLLSDLPYSKADEKLDFKYASDLVLFVKRHYGDYFCVGVAGYPEKRPDLNYVEEEIIHLKNKVIITQKYRV